MLASVIEKSTKPAEAGETPAASRGPSWLFTFLKVGLSVLAVGVVVHTVDLGAVWQRMSHQNLALVAVAAAALLGQIVLGGLRWHVILARLASRNSIVESLRLFFIAAFFNTWVWGAIAGDVVRAWLSSRVHVSVKTAVTSVLLDRVAAVAGVALLVIMTAPLLLERMGYNFAALLPSVIAVVGLLCIGILAQVRRLPLNWQNNRLLRGVHGLSAATALIFLRPRAAFTALGLAIAAQVALSLSAYVLGWSLDIRLTLLDCFVFIQPIVLITALPISIGGWGVRETAMIGALAIVGVPASAALALSIQLGALSMLAALPGGVLWLKLKPRTAVQR